MTLVVAWVRITPGGEELVVASDSRLTGGILLNHAPKIFQLERQDAVLAYCGPTIVAYPILQQIKASLDGHEETRSRVLDIVHLKAHIEKVIESIRSNVSDLPCKDGTNREFKFLLAGYSWKMSAFRMWTFRYDMTTGEFNAHSARKSGNFIFMSDKAKNEKRAIDSLIQSIKIKKGMLKRLDWQPMQVLVDIIRDLDITDIGGPPQLVKIYKHANTLPINVLWPKKESETMCSERKFVVTHLGRPLLEYERSRYLSMDPDTLELIEPWNVANRLDSLQLNESARVKKHLQTNLCRAISALRKKKALTNAINCLVQEGAKWDEIDALMKSSHTTAF